LPFPISFHIEVIIFSGKKLFINPFLFKKQEKNTQAPEGRYQEDSKHLVERRNTFVQKRGVHRRRFRMKLEKDEA
jgi:hypothetical protein